MRQCTLGKIRTIEGEFVWDGASSFSRRVHARRASYEVVYMMDKSPTHQKLNAIVAISFGEEDCAGVLYSHDDALVVTLLVANYTTRCIFVDNDSLTNIILGGLRENMHRCI